LLMRTTDGRAGARRRSGTDAERSGSDGTDFNLETFLPYQLATAATRVSRLFGRHYADHHGLSLPEWRVIAIVGRHAGISPSAVSERSVMDKVKVSRAAASLVKRGLLKQVQDPDDGRARRLHLTKRGENMLRDLVPLARQLESEVASSMSRSEWSSLRQALGRINDAIPLDAPSGEDE